jgi:hypothetical protein
MPNLWTPAGPIGTRRMMLNKRFSRMAIFGSCSVIFLILVFWSRIHGSYGVSEYYSFSTTSSFFPVSIDPAQKTTSELCASFPKHLLQTIQPVLKLGHADAKDRIDAQFDSVSACFGKDELLVYSDLDEEVRGHQVIDVLADLPELYYHDNPDFINYIWQKEMRENGTLDVDREATSRINGWRMDKFKFLPMIERAWRTKPNKDFYFFFETDTLVLPITISMLALITTSDMSFGITPFDSSRPSTPMRPSTWVLPRREDTTSSRTSRHGSQTADLALSSAAAPSRPS